MVAGFTSAEREYIRSELDMFFSTLPSVAEGFQIRTWRGGPQAGKPKVPQAAQGLLDRGLVRLDLTGRPRHPRWQFRGPPAGCLTLRHSENGLVPGQQFSMRTSRGRAS